MAAHKMTITNIRRSQGIPVETYRIHRMDPIGRQDALDIARRLGYDPVGIEASNMPDEDGEHPFNVTCVPYADEYPT